MAVFGDISPAVLARAVAAEAEHLAARSALSDAIVAASPFKKGDTVRDRHTGARYRVTGGSGYQHDGRPNLLLTGVRVYSTGRREARQTSHIDPRDLEKVEA